MRRKDFLRLSALGALGVGLGKGTSSCNFSHPYPIWQGKRLVLIQLRGGHDGLFAMPFLNSDVVQKARPKLQKTAQKNSIALENGWYCNVMLKKLVPLWETGELIAIPNIGYSQPSRSHFVAQEYWDTGIILNSDVSNLRGTGWLGRHWESKDVINGQPDLFVNPFVNLHGSPTIYDKGESVKAINVLDINPLRWYGDCISGDIGYSNDKLKWINLEINTQLEVLKWFQDFDSFKGRTNASLTQQLERAFDIIKSNMPFVAIHTVLDGFDTHAGEVERLTDLYEDLGGSISNFARNLKQSGQWNDTLVFVYSDFGRTIGENDNGGTDHGHAGLSFLLGGDLRAFSDLRNMQVPELEKSNGQMFLKYGVDFRDLIARVRNFI